MQGWRFFVFIYGSVAFYSHKFLRITSGPSSILRLKPWEIWVNKPHATIRTDHIKTTNRVPIGRGTEQSFKPFWPADGTKPSLEPMLIQYQAGFRRSPESKFARRFHELEKYIRRLHFISCHISQWGQWVNFQHNPYFTAVHPETKSDYFKTTETPQV